EAAIRLIWGSGSYSIEAPPELSGIVQLPVLVAYPKYRLFVIAIGVAVGALLVAFLQLTRLGLTVRGVSNDPEMVAVLGVNVPLVRTCVFALGTGMAGLAGVIVGPLVSAYPAMGIDIIIDAFVVLFVGGLGSLWGAVLAALGIFPFFSPGSFWISLAGETFVLALWAVSLDLLVGYTGLVSFGHAAYFGLGAYGSALVMIHLAPSLLVGIVGGTLVAAGMAALVGWLSVRRPGVAFSMLSL